MTLGGVFHPDRLLKKYLAPLWTIAVHQPSMIFPVRHLLFQHPTNGVAQRQEFFTIGPRHEKWNL